MENEEDFFKMIQNARQEFWENPEFRSDSWKWAHELDDEGFFVFCYLIHDYNEQVLTQTSLQETVYTLNLLRHKLLPSHLCQKNRISVLDQFQILFNLYERLKRESMHWDACEAFVQEQVQHLYQSN